jgi:hypothetical protein
MADIEVWASGQPAPGQTVQHVQENVRMLFPDATAAQLARFTAGTRFVVTKASEDAAKQVVEALMRCGVLAELGPALSPLVGVTLSAAPAPAPTLRPIATPASAQLFDRSQAVPRAAPESAPKVAGAPRAPRAKSQPQRTAYVSSTLIPGEEVVGVSKQSLLTNLVWKFIAVTMLLMAFTNAATAVLLLPVSGVMLVSLLLPYWTTELVLTNKRVTAKFGFINRRTIDLKIEKVESVQIRQSVLGRIFNYGSIVLAGTGTPQEAVPDIANPLAFHRAFFELQEFVLHGE